eukprot:m.230387 g.230387  ORF g.230387 m.230387 type:complete len:257 (-) comp12054_c0_seq1:48-818(-)
MAAVRCSSLFSEAALRFAGKRAVITGAGKGIGKDTAKELARLGAEVIAVSRTQADLDALTAEVPSIIPLCVDVANSEATRKALEAAGPIDLVVNNAGIARLEKFLTAKADDFDATMQVNVKAAMIVSQVAAKSMIERGVGGAIVNVSSQASEVGLAEHAAYCASKGALDQLTRVMAVELGPHNIRVNCVNPTVVLTDMGRIGWSDPKKAGPMLSKIPLGRFAEVNDVVPAICFLLSDQSKMINGVMLPIDGGFLAT